MNLGYRANAPGRLAVYSGLMRTSQSSPSSRSARSHVGVVASPASRSSAGTPPNDGIPSTTSERSPSRTVRSITSPSTSGESSSTSIRRPATAQRVSLVGRPRRDTEAEAEPRARPRKRRKSASPVDDQGPVGKRRRTSPRSPRASGASATAVASHSRIRGMPWMPRPAPARSRVDRRRLARPGSPPRARAAGATAPSGRSALRRLDRGRLTGGRLDQAVVAVATAVDDVDLARVSGCGRRRSRGRSARAGRSPPPALIGLSDELLRLHDHRRPPRPRDGMSDRHEHVRCAVRARGGLLPVAA